MLRLSRRSLALSMPALITLRPSSGRAAEDKYFDSAGVRIRYVEAGQGDPVVLVHGFSSNVENQWVRSGVMPKLADRYRVIAFDGRGHGLSDKPHDPALYGPEASRDTSRLLDHLGLRKAHVVGYSLGAHLVAWLVTDSPDRFVTCTLGGACGRFRWSEEKTAEVLAEAAEMDEGLQRSQILRLWPKDQPPPSDEQIRAQSARALAGQDHKALAASRRGGLRLVMPEERMAAITVPAIGIVGSADGYLADFTALRQINPRIDVTVIEGAGHSAAPGRPEFVQTLDRFLSAHRA
ncbi:alpha/beta fold hydrolase [Roseomonas populi]|uniref:Alpha/beta hydrolase n=1 Tax=Roseomonas populi TaxID=3121582 RepID=A0ABT1X4Q1_9PROT|nr:alpha/beta hydrolase [Roseomonas pecuniae]MCR0983083.1 alpha/beta hydrolase [Roseomonas pecuniae]